MKIVIAGAGDVGFHLAELLSFENQDIILIDSNQDVLDYAATHLDVMTVRGDATSIDVLKQAEVSNANLMLAVTTSEKTNIVTAILAKKMGARQCIARVTNPEYLEDDQVEVFKELGVDSTISPRQLAAEEIARLVKQCSFTDVFEFENGKISLVGITLKRNSSLARTKLKNIKAFDENLKLRPIAILRGHKTIIPRGETELLPNDHIYFISKPENIDDLIRIVGEKKVTIKDIMIIGGSDLAYATARRLEREYNVTLIEKDGEKCKLLCEELSNTLIVKGDPSNIDMLEEEGLNRMDAFIALSSNPETNIVSSLTAKNKGVHKTIALVENKEYTHISQNIGVDTLINKKLIAANNIFRYVRKGRIEAITSLHGVDAEVIEFVVQRKNRLTKKPLRDQHFPQASLIGGVIRGDESFLPEGDFQLEVGDKVIVFALPEAIGKIEKMFH